MRVLASTGTARLNASDFVNTGTVDVQSGTLGLGARVMSSGTFAGVMEKICARRENHPANARARNFAHEGLRAMTR